ncbi:MAG: endonuclease domain-containing protein [Xanthobacteraceae bacterium]
MSQLRTLRRNEFRKRSMLSPLPGAERVDRPKANPGLSNSMAGNILRDRDKRRDAWLDKQGFKVMRFWNNDVLKNGNAALEMIWMALEECRSLGALCEPPSPQWGEEKRGDHP